MSLKLMYITNQPTIAKIAQNAGVDRIFVDMEYIGKVQRQGGMDTVQCKHTLDDVRCVRQAISSAELLVRINPVHDAIGNYIGTEAEIESVLQNGADALMLPYFKETGEVERFVKAVEGRAKIILLLETPEAVLNLDDILLVGGIDEIHIGINDLSLGYGKKFMFELLADGTVESVCHKISGYGLSCGFGGIASLGRGALPAEYIIMEHYRIGSSAAILSRSFCDSNKIDDLDKIYNIFTKDLEAIRKYEKFCAANPDLWEENRKDAAKIIAEIAAGM